jgi:hypothetical protein
MNDELGRAWKEAAMAYFKLIFQIFPDEIKETSVKFSELQHEI